METITNRPCKIGTSIPSRAEMHGDESVTAMDIPVEGIMLDAEELNMLLGEPRAHDVLYTKGVTGKPAEPALSKIRTLYVDDKYEGATVTFRLGLAREEVKLGNVKLAKLELEPQVGGMTALSLTIQCTPKLGPDIPKILGFLKREVEIEIEGAEVIEAKKDQAQLPLDGEGNAPKKRGRPRKGAE